MATDVYVRALLKAVELKGGVLELAAELSVSPLHVRLWAEGRAQIPTAIFLRVVDILLPAEGGRLQDTTDPAEKPL